MNENPTRTATTNGENVNITIDDHIFTITPRQATTLATKIIGAANDLIAPKDLNIGDDIFAGVRLHYSISKRKHVNIEWKTPNYHRRLTIHRAKLRPMADRLHDMADQLEERGHEMETQP